MQKFPQNGRQSLKVPARRRRDQLLTEQCGFPRGNFEFWPFIHPKSDTHYPYPKPTISRKQMGFTHPIPIMLEFALGDTRHPPTHDQKWPGGKP